MESFIGKLRDELLNGEIFYTLTEAKVLVQRWRHLYNRVRPHSALTYRPPAPEAIEPLTPGIPELLDIGEQRLTQKWDNFRGQVINMVSRQFPQDTRGGSKPAFYGGRGSPPGIGLAIMRSPPLHADRKNGCRVIDFVLVSLNGLHLLG